MARSTTAAIRTGTRSQPPPRRQHRSSSPFGLRALRIDAGAPPTAQERTGAAPLVRRGQKPVIETFRGRLTGRSTSSPGLRATLRHIGVMPLLVSFRQLGDLAEASVSEVGRRTWRWSSRPTRYTIHQRPVEPCASCHSCLALPQQPKGRPRPRSSRCCISHSSDISSCCQYPPDTPCPQTPGTWGSTARVGYREPESPRLRTHGDNRYVVSESWTETSSVPSLAPSARRPAISISSFDVLPDRSGSHPSLSGPAFRSGRVEHWPRCPQ